MESITVNSIKKQNKNGMKRFLVFIVFLILGCTTKREKAEQKAKAYADSAKSDSIKFVKKTKENNETDRILYDGRLITIDEFDSIFTGKKRALLLPASKN